MKNLLTQWETKEENLRFLIKLSNHGLEKVTWEHKQKVQFFLACLLVLLTGRPRFRFVIGLAGLIVGLAIGGAESTSREVAVSFLSWSLWNKLISFLRYYTAKTGSQLFSSSW